MNQPPNKLTESISRLHEAEYQLSHLARNIGGNYGRHAKEIETEVRRARMRIEEFRAIVGGALDFSTDIFAAVPLDLRDRINRVKGECNG